MSSRPSQVVSGLVDGIEVLRELAVSAEPVAGIELAERTGLSVVRVSRLLTTLAWMGIAHRDRSRKYTIGPGIHTLATLNLGASGTLSRAIRHLEPLLDYPYTVAVGVLWRDMVAYLFHRSPGQSVAEGVSPEVARRIVMPASHSSIGMAMLAQLPNSRIHDLFDNKPTPLPGLYADVDALLEKIEEVRLVGYASLRYPTHVSLAKTVGNPPYAAIAISGFESPEDEKKFCHMLDDIASGFNDQASDAESDLIDSLEFDLSELTPSALA